MSSERLGALRSQLTELEDAPLDTHPAALAEVHRTLVAELDSLAREAAAPGARPSADGA